MGRKLGRYSLRNSFTPLPHKLFTVLAGVFSDVVPLHTLLVASILGRSSRFFLVATAAGFVAVHLYLASG